MNDSEREKFRKKLEEFIHNHDTQTGQAALVASEDALFDKSYHEQKMAKLREDTAEDYLAARKKWRLGIGLLLAAVSGFHIYFCWQLFFHIATSDAVLGTVTVSLTVEVLGLAAIIVRHLFPNNDKYPFI